MRGWDACDFFFCMPQKQKQQMPARYDLTRLVHPAVQLQHTSSSCGSTLRPGGNIPLVVSVRAGGSESDISDLTENGTSETQDIRAKSGDIVTQIVDYSRNERIRREASSAEGVLEDESTGVPTRIGGTPVEFLYNGALSMEEVENPIRHHDFSVKSSMIY